MSNTTSGNSPSPWVLKYLISAECATASICVIVPKAVAAGLISHGACVLFLPVWPNNIEFTKEMVGFGLPEAYVDSFTMAVSAGTIIAVAYFIVRGILEIVYNSKILVPINVFLALFGLFVWMFYICFYATDFKRGYRSAILNPDYNSSWNSFMITFSILAMVLFGSESLFQTIRYLRFYGQNCRSRNTESNT